MGPAHARVLGVDPGLKGALALWDTRSDKLTIRDMPVAAGAVSPQLLSWELRELGPELAWVEQVHSMPKQGVSSTFKFGASYGMVLGVLAALEVRAILVPPSQWKGSLHLSRDKDASRGLAIRLFPKHAGLFSRVKDEGRAEAALVAYYGANCLSKHLTG